MRIKVTLIIALLICPVISAKAQNWPAFRGANASGNADGQNPPTSWNVEKNENIVWKTPIPGLAHASPIVWGNKLFVITAVSGAPQGKFRHGLYGDVDSEVTVGTPVVGHDLVFVTAGYPPIQPIYAIKPTAAGNITPAEGKESNDHIAWSKKRGGTYMPTPIVYGDHLYTCSNNGVLTCYDAKTGERIYQQRVAGQSSAFTASPIAADGKLYFTGEDGDVFVVKAGPKYELLATNPMGEVMMATPAISGGMIFVRTIGHVYGIADASASKQKAAK